MDFIFHGRKPWENTHPKKALPLAISIFAKTSPLQGTLGLSGSTTVG
jgi:hypothetical protein